MDSNNLDYESRCENTRLVLRKLRKMLHILDDYDHIVSSLKSDNDRITENDLARHERKYINSEKLNSKYRSTLMIMHILKMLSLYKSFCLNSNDSLKTLQYNVMYDAYLTKDKLKRDDILEKYNIPKALYYKLLKNSYRELSNLIFCINEKINSFFLN